MIDIILKFICLQMHGKTNLLMICLVKNSEIIKELKKRLVEVLQVN